MDGTTTIQGGLIMKYITYLIIATSIGMTIANLIYIYEIVRMMRKKK